LRGAGAYNIAVICVKHRDEILQYTGEPHLEIVGNSECVVDGLQGIVEYTKEKIKINLGKYLVTFEGDGLFINAFSPEGAVVEGCIMMIGFETND